MGKQSQLAFARIYRMKVLFRGDAESPDTNQMTTPIIAGAGVVI